MQLLLHSRWYLFGLESRWDPWVLLGGTARVVVGDGVSLEVWYQLGHHLFQLARHGAHGVLFSHTLAVHTDLPVETRDSGGLYLYWPNGFTTEGQMSNTGSDSGVFLGVDRFGHKTLGAKIWTLLKSEIECFFAEARNQRQKWRKISFQTWMWISAFTQSHLHNFF